MKRGSFLFVLVPVLLGMAVLFVSCFSPWQGNTGNLSVNLGGAGRAWGDPEELAGLDHTVFFSGSSGSMTVEAKGAGIITVSVAPGPWEITVRSFRDGVLYAEGFALVEVEPGKHNTAEVQMGQALSAGLYRMVTVGGRYAPVTNNAGTHITDFDEAFTIVTTAGADGPYLMRLDAPVSIQPKVLNTAVKLTLEGMESTRDITLDGNGSLFTVGAAAATGTAELVLGRNIALKGKGTAVTNSAPLVRVNANGKLTMETGSFISDNSSTFLNGGGGVYINYGVFLMNGGEITRNSTSSGDGGGVNMANGIFDMKGGIISNNSTTSNRLGGGVCVDGGIFTMEGSALITRNNTQKKGGGVYVNSTAQFDMNGGTISYNNVTNPAGPVDGGGGVYVANNAEFNLDGGTISYNETFNTGNVQNNGSSGGGVCVAEGGAFAMYTGTITKNKVNYYSAGGGVLVEGSFTMWNGTISDNEAGDRGSGGGVVVRRNTVGVAPVPGTFTMWNGTISGNKTLRGDGGGVCISGNGVEFTMKDGTIKNNILLNGGGGGVVISDGNFSMEGGIISGNTDTRFSGGVWCYTGTFSKSGNSIIYGLTANDDFDDNSNRTGSGNGHAVFAQPLSLRRIHTAGEGMDLDSTVPGGNWE